MPEIGIRELKEQASKILREVREKGETYTVTYQGKPCGILLPYSPGVTKRKGKSKESGLASLRGILRGTPDIPWEEFMDVKKMWTGRADALAEEIKHGEEQDKEQGG